MWRSLFLDDSELWFEFDYFSCAAKIWIMVSWEVHDKGELVAIVTLDLSKAFDFLLHLLLIKKLEAYGLDNRSCSFLPEFLQNRSQRVKVGDAVPSWELTSKGVPPGSVLGPLLFKSSCLSDSSYIKKALPHYLTELAKNWHVDLIWGL